MYTLTVGLEIHAELATRTKMFCACLNDPDEVSPNKNICPICMAHPGTLPVINKEAVRKVLAVGKAVNGSLADYTEFDRKNYFYPDIPKGYQISQYKYPLVSGGSLAGVELTRIHLEEDTARSQHTSTSLSTGQGNTSLVDYNRAGVPLMELVTEPVIGSAEAAGDFARELQLLLRTLGAGEANMEKGEMRVEANISVSKTPTFGTKVEVKNLNSFRSVERAIQYEFDRQVKLLESGGEVVQETRGWDEIKQQTFGQRKKEKAHDYRYFPDPDLPSLRLSESTRIDSIELPELPWQKRERYLALGINPEYAEMFVADEVLAKLFEATVAADESLAKAASNYIGSDIVGLAARLGRKGLSHIAPGALADVLRRTVRGELSSRGAKEAIVEVFTTGGDLVMVAQKYLQQNDERALLDIAKKVVEEHTQVAADFKAGKEAAMQFLVGQGMKLSKGSANPQALRTAIQKVLG